MTGFTVFFQMTDYVIVIGIVKGGGECKQRREREEETQVKPSATLFKLASEQIHLEICNL